MARKRESTDRHDASNDSKRAKESGTNCSIDAPPTDFEDTGALEQDVNETPETRCIELFPTKKSYDYAVKDLKLVLANARNDTNVTQKTIMTYRGPMLDYMGFTRNILK